jgi:hypothetical protein
MAARPPDAVRRRGAASPQSPRVASAALSFASTERPDACVRADAEREQMLTKWANGLWARILSVVKKILLKNMGIRLNTREYT